MNWVKASYGGRCRWVRPAGDRVHVMSLILLLSVSVDCRTVPPAADCASSSQTPLSNVDKWADKIEFLLRSVQLSQTPHAHLVDSRGGSQSRLNLLTTVKIIQFLSTATAASVTHQLSDNYSLICLQHLCPIRQWWTGPSCSDCCI